FVEGFHDALTNTTAGAIRTATRIAQGLRNLRAVRQDRQQIGDAIAQFATVADHVDRAMFQQELRTLEAFRQRLAHRLLDHARACETDQRLGFGDVDITQHRETRGHAAGGRVRQHHDVWQPGRAQARERGGSFGHLQQRLQAFLHARAAGGGEADERLLVAQCGFGRARDLLTDHRTHRAAHVTEFERAGDHRHALEAAFDGNQRVLLAAALLRGEDAVAVFLRVLEFQRIDRPHAGVEFIAALIEEPREPRARADRMMVAALRAHHQVALEFRPVQADAATGALFPHAFRHLAAAGRAFGTDFRCGQFLQPGHEGFPVGLQPPRIHRDADQRPSSPTRMGPRKALARWHTSAAAAAPARVSTNAEPITTASANAATAFAPVASLMPKPTATGTFARPRRPLTRWAMSPADNFAAPVMPANDT